MHSRYVPRRGVWRAAAGLALLALAACGDDPQLIITPTPQATAGAMFNSYVAMGNSITAGYQSGGLNDSTQAESYARLLAQKFGTPYVYGRINMPGCAPPTANFLTGARVAGAPSTTCALLVNPVGPALNNVAVPGATSFDPTAATTSASNILTSLLLNGKTQVQRALDARPTFVSIWIGNNDALQAAATGLLTATPGISIGLTDTTTFKTNYGNMLTQLTTAQPDLEGVLIGVVNASAAPLLFPVAALYNPTALTGFAQATGGTTAADITLHPNCGNAGAPNGALISFAIAAQIRAYRANPSASGAHPPLISCGVTAAAPAPVGDIFVLTTAEQATLNAYITSYNTFISSRATALGWAYADPNPTLLATKAADQAAADPRITVFPRLDIAQTSGGTRSPFGTWFSFDGVHPSRDAHVAIANVIITAINAKYNTTVGTCTLATVRPPQCT